MSDLFTSSRLSYHAPSMDHLDALAGLWSDPQTMQYVGAGKPWSREDVAQRLQRAIALHQQTGMAFWTVKLAETNEIIGQAGVVPIEGKGPEIELGYRLGRQHWGLGYATEAAIARANYATDPAGPLKLAKLVAVAHPQNAASRRVLDKAGLTHLGETNRYYSVNCSLYEFVRAARTLSLL